MRNDRACHVQKAVVGKGLLVNINSFLPPDSLPVLPGASKGKWDMTIIHLSSSIARPCGLRPPLCSVGQGQLFGERALKNTEYALWRSISFLVMAVILPMLCIILEVSGGECR